MVLKLVLKHLYCITVNTGVHQQCYQPIIANVLVKIKCSWHVVFIGTNVFHIGRRYRILSTMFQSGPKFTNSAH